MGSGGSRTGPGSGGTVTLELSPDGLRLGVPGDPNQLTRIVDLSAIAPTGLSVSTAVGSSGGTTTLTATLTSAGSPFAGQQVSFSLNGSPAGTATTNAAGVATLSGVSLAGIGAGNYAGGVQAAFAGDATHAPAAGSATLTVAKAAPVARGVVVTTQEGVTKSGTLLATDAEGDPLTFSIVTPPTKGTLTLVDAATGAFTYTPNAGAIGYDSFTFRAADAGGASSTATGAVFIVAASPRWPGQTVRASVATDGTEQNGASTLGAVPSADGRFIAFSSGSRRICGRHTSRQCQRLRARPADGADDAGEHGERRWAGNRRRPAVIDAGRAVRGVHHDWLESAGRRPECGRSTPSSTIARRARPRASASRATAHRATARTRCPVISADGRYVAFSGDGHESGAGDTERDDEDVFLHDRQTGQTTLVSVTSAGVQGNTDSWRPSISADGRFIAFNSESTNLVAGRHQWPRSTCSCATC